VAEIFEAVVFYLDKCGEINNIIHKMEATIVNKVNFNWITCNMHKNEIKKDILYLTIKLVVFKSLQDIQRKFNEKNKAKKYQRRINILQHISGIN
jgi:hypothetical protein